MIWTFYPSFWSILNTPRRSFLILYGMMSILLYPSAIALPMRPHYAVFFVIVTLTVFIIRVGKHHTYPYFLPPDLHWHFCYCQPRMLRISDPGELFSSTTSSPPPLLFSYLYDDPKLFKLEYLRASWSSDAFIISFLNNIFWHCFSIKREADHHTLSTVANWELRLFHRVEGRLPEFLRP